LFFVCLLQASLTPLPLLREAPLLDLLRFFSLARWLRFC